MNNKSLDYNEILFYETDDGKVCIEVRFENENLWLTQKHMAELFDCSIDNISLHLKNIYLCKELDKNSTTEESSIVQKEGEREVKRDVVFYNLEAVISVGYRVNSERGAAFRTWATDKLKKYIFKGFVIDSNRFKNGSKFDTRFFDELLEEIREIRASERVAYQKITDIYATSVDYASCSVETKNFFAVVQNKLHFAITGNTAAEIIANRVDGSKPLTNWRKAPKGKIFSSDAQVAKNYLDKNEITQLNRIVNMYIDYAEFQAARGKIMYMKDWKEKLDAFLKFNEQDILQSYGKVSHEVAITLAAKEYEIFRKTQDKSYKSDFDKLIEEKKSLDQKSVKA